LAVAALDETPVDNDLIDLALAAELTADRNSTKPAHRTIRGHEALSEAFFVVHTRRQVGALPEPRRAWRPPLRLTEAFDSAFEQSVDEATLERPLTAGRLSRSLRQIL
jgi:hypothetical protein